MSRDRPDEAGDRAAAASGELAARAEADPVRVRRARIARWSLLANRVGYLLFGLAVALFVVAFVVGFTGPLVTAIVVDPAEVRAEAGFGLRPPVERARGGLGDGLEQLAAHLVEEREVEPPLGREVLVQHGLGHARGVGHVVHRGAVEPLAGEDLEADGQELFPAGRRGSGTCARSRG